MQTGLSKFSLLVIVGVICVILLGVSWDFTDQYSGPAVVPTQKEKDKELDYYHEQDDQTEDNDKDQDPVIDDTEEDLNDTGETEDIGGDTDEETEEEFVEIEEKEPEYPNVNVITHIPENYNDVGNTLIVTGYWELGTRSKFNTDRYINWISMFLPKIDNLIVIYTDVPEVLFPFRAGLPTIYVNISMDTLKSIGNYSPEYLSKNHDSDPEKHIHSPELYVIWNSKTRLVYHALNRYNPFNYKYIMWVDIGSFRSGHSLKYWPDPTRVREVFDQAPNRTLYASVKWPGSDYIRNYNVDMGPFPTTDLFIQGGFFAATEQSITTLYKDFYDMHDLFSQRGYFVGKDQSVMGALALAKKEKFMIMDVTGINCMDQWFFFQQFFAAEKERMSHCTNNIRPLVFFDKL